ncbi:hypothetical protein CWR48_13175 [Oceanobacillus arenosus]|uniref:HTH merR-type domain-containing protein n=1 Tax=Oceanobacillus arenosus TaxID=1229153 RepID=A0A3D8PQC3_9BACI|nr:MerR family transcriptional regulator [Oceanobacillus arenosus]RDW17471.1 hypothetical protein CWR48_13175 [Oceanobacillus arenosus]
MKHIGKTLTNTGLTERTLDYYDESGLIQLSSKMSKVHRLYTTNEMMRLERAFIAKFEGELK